MPIYVYRCEACGAEEEHMQRFSDPPMTECASCGGPLKKQITGAAFHLKGGGWYKDGYASQKPGSGGDSGGASKTDSGGKSGGDSGGTSGGDSASKTKTKSSDTSSKGSSSQ